MVWIWGILVLAGLLFAAKMAYVVSTALVLPATRGALYVSTSRARIDAALDAVPMTADQLLVDLGCGDGRVLRRATDRYGVRAVGYELNPMAYLRARLRCMGNRRLSVVHANFWQVDIAGADVVFCYLFPDVMARLAGKLHAEAKTGLQVVSFNFPVPGIGPGRVMRPTGALNNDPIFIYRIEPQPDIS